MGTLAHCPGCKKWVVFGEFDRNRYNELVYIFGGVTTTSKCPQCKTKLESRD